LYLNSLEVSMRYSLLLSVAALASALALGCTDRPVPTGPAGSLPASLPTNRSPDGWGALVSRAPDDFSALIIDEERGLTALLGSTPEEIAPACLSGMEPESTLTQLVIRPDSSVKAVAKGRELGVTVWAALSGDLCGELVGVTPLASGTARVIYVDNDAFLSFERANAFSVRAHGTVTSLATGEEFRLLVRFHAVWFPNEPAPEVQVSEVQLSPTGP
jgi:hypothetical protein